jgi:hypothetical protein
MVRIIACLTAFAAAACGDERSAVETIGAGLTDANRQFFDDRLSALFAGPQPATAPFAALTDFSWDRVCLYPPYIDPSWDEPDAHPFYRGDWLADERHARLVFSRGGELRLVAVLPSNAGGDDSGGKRRVCEGADARYVLKTIRRRAWRQDGSEWISEYRYFGIAGRAAPAR